MRTPMLENDAYGWEVAAPSPRTYGHARMSHSGGINGFGANFILVPELADAPGPGKFELTPESETRFFSDTPEVTITFTVANGAASQLMLNFGVRDRIAKRVE